MITKNINQSLLDGVIAKVLVECGASPTDFEWKDDVVVLNLPRGAVRFRFSKVAYQDLEGVSERLRKKASKKGLP